MANQGTDRTDLGHGLLFALTELMVKHARMYGDVEIGLEAAREAAEAGVARCITVLQSLPGAEKIDLAERLKPALDTAERTARGVLRLPRRHRPFH